MGSPESVRGTARLIYGERGTDRVRYLTKPSEVVRDISLHRSIHVIITTQLLLGL